MTKKALSLEEWMAIRKDHIAAIKLMLMQSEQDYNVVECGVKIEHNNYYEEIVCNVYLSEGNVMLETLDGCRLSIDILYTSDLEDIRKYMYNQTK